MLVTGSGRAGTTFLIKLLVRLGLDAGWTPETVDAAVDAASGGGLEHPMNAARDAFWAAATAKIVKVTSAELGPLDDALAKRLEFVIVPYVRGTDYFSDGIAPTPRPRRG